MPRLADLQEARAAASGKMRALLDTADAETRDLTDAEDKNFKDLKAEVATLDKKIERARDLAEAERAAPAILHQGRGDGAFEDKARKFSVVKAIRSVIGDNVDAGFEREISRETEIRIGRAARGNVLVPDEYFQVQKRAFGDAIMNTTDGAHLIPNTHRGDLFIDLLRSALVTGRLGATVLDGLVGNVEIPKQATAATAAWYAEDASIVDSEPSFGEVTLAPKTVAAISSYTRRLLLNSVPSIEDIVKRDLVAVIANAIDLKALIGDGTSNTPSGVTKTGNSTELTLASPNWAEVLGFPATIQSNDGEVGSMAWVTTPAGVRTLRATTKVEDDGSAGFLMEGPNSLAGYPVATTTALPDAGGNSPADDTTIIFGVWSQLLIGYWSGVDLLVNPYETTAYQKGRVLVRVMRDCDVAIRHPEAFAYADDLAAFVAE